MVFIFAKLPSVTIHKILNYANVVKYRNGKYIDVIPADDIRYEILSKIPKPIKFYYSNKVVLNLLNKQVPNWYGVQMTYYFIERGNQYYLAVQGIRRINEGYNKYYKLGIKNIYLFDSNYKWYRTVEYTV